MMTNNYTNKTIGILFIIISIIINVVGLYLTYKYFSNNGQHTAALVTGTMLFVGTVLSIALIYLKKIDDLANHWIGLGVLFTFLSFLIVFKTNHNWSNVNEIIPTISSAFITSIIGIGMSKIIGVYLSIVERKTEEKRNYEEPEDVLISLRNYISELRNHTIQNNSAVNPVFIQLKNDMTVLKDAVIINNQQNVAILDKINNTFESLAGNIGNTINTGLEGVLENLATSLDGIVKNIGTDLNQNIETLIKELNTSTKGIIEEQSDANLKLIEEQKINLTNVLTGISEYQINVKELIDANKTLVDEQNQAHNVIIAEQQDLTNQTISEMRNSLGALVTEYKDLFDKNANSVEKTFERLENWENSTSERIDTINSKFGELVNKQTINDDFMREVLDNVKHQLNEIETLRNERTTDISLIIDKMDNSGQQLIVAKLDKIIDQLDKAA